MKLVRLLPAALVPLVAACDLVEGVAADPGTPAAGRYEIAEEVTRFEVPGLDLPKRNQMQKIMVGKQTTRNYCLSDAQAEKKGRALFEATGEGACSLHDFAPRDGRIDALMTCRAGSGRQSFALKGTVSRSGASFVEDGVVTSERFPQGRAFITRKIQMKRTGGCASAGAAVPAKRQG